MQPGRVFHAYQILHAMLLTASIQVFVFGWTVVQGYFAVAQSVGVNLKLEQSINPDAFLQRNYFSFGYFSSDETSAILLQPSFVGTINPSVMKLNCESGQVDLLVTADQIFDVSFPVNRLDHFVASQQGSQGPVEIVKYGLDGRKIKRLASIRTQSKDFLGRVFWNPATDQVVVVDFNVATVFRPGTPSQKIDLGGTTQRFACQVRDGKLFVGLKNRVSVFDLEDGSQIGTGKFSGQVTALDVSTKLGQIFAVANQANEAARTFQLLQLKFQHGEIRIDSKYDLDSEANRVQVLNDDRFIVSSYVRSTCFDVSRGKALWTRSNTVFASDSGTRALMTAKMRLELLDPQKNEIISPVVGHSHPILALNELDNQIIATVDYSGLFVGWETSTPKMMFHQQLNPERFFADFQQGKFFQLARNLDKARELQWLDWHGNSIRQIPNIEWNDPTLIKYVDQQTLLVVNENASDVDLLDLSNSQIRRWVGLRRLGVNDERSAIRDLAVSPKGTYALIHVANKALRDEPVSRFFVIDIASPDSFYELEADSIVGIPFLAVSHDEKSLAFVKGQRIKFHRLSDGVFQTESKIIEHCDFFSRLAFSPDDRLVAINTRNGWDKPKFGIAVYDREEDQLTLRHDVHDDSVSLLQFSGNGDRLYSCGQNGQIRIWRVEID